MKHNDLGLENQEKSLNKNRKLTSKKADNIAEICKAAAIAVFVFTFFIGLGSGYEYNFGLAFGIWIGSFLSCLFLYAIGEIINQLSIANVNTEKLQLQNDKIIELLYCDQAITNNTDNGSFEGLPNL